jgi:hypothetical protein
MLLARRPAPGPTIAQDKNATPQNGTGQPPPLKKGNGTATNGSNDGGNTTGTQNASPGPAITQNKNATPQNGGGQPPLLKKGNGTAPNARLPLPKKGNGTATNGSNAVPHPTLTLDKNATQPNANLPPLPSLRAAMAARPMGTRGRFWS